MNRCFALKPRWLFIAGLIGLCTLSAPVLSQQDETPSEPVEFPASLNDRLSGLSPEQLAFLSSPEKTRSFARTTDILIENLQKRTASEVRAYLGD
jgi:hypothetical protein